MRLLTNTPGDAVIALAEQGNIGHPPSRTPTASIEYSEGEAASISLRSHSAPPDPMGSDTIDLVTGTRGNPPGVQRQPYSYGQGSAPYYPDVCYECFVPGHRKPNCPHLNRSSLDVAFRNWVFANFARLETWVQERLRSLGRAPLDLQANFHPRPSDTQAPTELAATTQTPTVVGAPADAVTTAPAQPRIVQRRPETKN